LVNACAQITTARHVTHFHPHSDTTAIRRITFVLRNAGGSRTTNERLANSRIAIEEPQHLARNLVSPPNLVDQHPEELAIGCKVAKLKLEPKVFDKSFVLDGHGVPLRARALRCGRLFVDDWRSPPSNPELSLNQLKPSRKLY
jgi:hypothetical protein